MEFVVYCVVAFVVRLFFIVYGTVQDETSDVQFTDVDYKVFTDAARHVLNGDSPFMRHTYRYSPLMAYLCLPNLLIHPAAGKILFSLSDILVGALIFKILGIKGIEKSQCCKFSLFWLFNPLSVVISTRGNSDSLAALLVVGTLYFFMKGEFIWAGLVYGLGVHFRLYPAVFSVPLYFSLGSNSQNYLMKLFYPNQERLKLVIASVASFVFFTTLFYFLYGFEFLHESMFFHLKRTDIRHNYSIYFYLQYLSYGIDSAAYVKFVTLFPQLTLLIALPFVYNTREHLFFCLFCLAFVLVMFNSVLTCQYFIWYASLLPLCLPNMFWSSSKTELFLVSNFWFVAQVAWLLPAYLLEHKSENTFFFIWFQCLVFFWSNVVVLTSCIRNYGAKVKVI